MKHSLSIVAALSAFLLPLQAQAAYERKVDGWDIRADRQTCSVSGPGPVRFYPNEDGTARITIPIDKAVASSLGRSAGQRVALDFTTGGKTYPVTYKRPGNAAGSLGGGALGGGLGGLSGSAAAQAEGEVSTAVFADLAAAPNWTLVDPNTRTIVAQGKLSAAAMRGVVACLASFTQPNRRVEPLSKPESWFTFGYMPTARYSGEAIQRGWVTLGVGVDGRVSSCSFDTSTGRTDHDNVVCNNFYGRARFSPATDADGKAVPSTYRLQTPKVVLPLDSQRGMTDPVLLRAGCREGKVVGRVCFTLSGN